jgi:erythromycin esterase-like protein
MNLLSFRLLTAAAMVTSSTLAACAREASPEAVAWAKQRIKPLVSVEAGQGFSDLEPLRAMIGSARVVGLGEATHGTREHFQLKHRLAEFLASEMGFTIFSIEASSPEAFAVDDFVSGTMPDEQAPDPAALIGGMYFWTWNTEEVLAMVRWMRSFNQAERAAGSTRHLRFTGFDMQTISQCRRIVREFVEKRDPEFLASLDTHTDTIRRMATEGGAGGGFGAAISAIKIDAARGKKLAITGFIRTEGVEGTAAAWCRVDGPGDRPLAFDRMDDRALKGDTDWTPFTISLDVPNDATGIVFGMLLNGMGTAWYDDFAVTLDGQPYDAKGDFDGSFDGAERVGFRPTRPAQFDAQIDRAIKRTGAGSLRFQSAERGKASTPAEALASAEAIIKRLSAGRAAAIASGATPADADWAIQNARIMKQWAVTNGPDGGVAARDQAMAENVLWLLEQNPEAKVILWAHNWHVSTINHWMGKHLRDKLGEQYLAIGLAAGGGEYRAMPSPGNGGPRGSSAFIHTLQEPTDYSAEGILRGTGVPLGYLDLRNPTDDDPGTAWLRGVIGFGSIGAVQLDRRFMPTPVGKMFDVLMWTDRTTPARQLPTSPAQPGN